MGMIAVQIAIVMRERSEWTICPVDGRLPDTCGSSRLSSAWHRTKWCTSVVAFWLGALHGPDFSCPVK
jgi:hypothetical protein